MRNDAPRFGVPLFKRFPSLFPLKRAHLITVLGVNPNRNLSRPAGYGSPSPGGEGRGEVELSSIPQSKIKNSLEMRTFKDTLVPRKTRTTDEQIRRSHGQ